MEPSTPQLHLRPPGPADLPELFTLHADPDVWRHLPTSVHTVPGQTEEKLGRWIADWERDGLGTWIVRSTDDGALLGHAGCTVRQGCFWNLGYRFSPAAQGRGFATEVSRLAITAARELRPELPVVAYLLEHNTASARVAEKVGLQLQHRAPDVGNPNPAAIRLVYADRELTEAQLEATLR